MELTVGERIFYSTVLVESKLRNNKNTTATAFFYSAEVLPNRSTVLLVSNKHVLSDSVALKLHLHAGDHNGPKSGERHTIELGPEFEVLEHPDPLVDVAAVNISGIVPQLQTTSYFLFIDSSIALSPATDTNLIGAIEQVRFIGYPLGMFDSSNLLPIARTGYTASPLLNDYEGKPAVLIDGSVFPGSSGSPVFILDTSGFYQTRDGTSHAGARCIFIGVLAAFQSRQISGQVVRLPASTMITTEEALDLGLVFKAATIDKLVDAVRERAAAEIPPGP